MKDLDFSDALIGYTNQKYGCEKTVTFDKDASNSYAFEMLREMV